MSEEEHSKKVKAWLGETSDITSTIKKTSFNAARSSVREILKEQSQTVHKLKNFSGSLPCSVFLPQFQLADIPGTNDLAAFNLSRTLTAVRTAESVILLAKQKDETLDDPLWDMLVQSDFLKKLCKRPDRYSLIVVINREYKPRETEVTLDDLLQEYDPKPFSDYIIQTAKEKLAHNPELAQRADNIKPLILPLFPKLFASMHLSSDVELVNVLKDMQLSLQEAKRRTNFPLLLGALHDLQVKKRLSEVKLLENWLDAWDEFQQDVTNSQDKKKYGKENVERSVEILDAVCTTLRVKLDEQIPELKTQHDASAEALKKQLKNLCDLCQKDARKTWNNFKIAYMYDNKSALAVWKPYWKEGGQTLTSFLFSKKDDLCNLLEQFTLSSFEASKVLNEITLQYHGDDDHDIIRLEKRLRECKLGSLAKELGKELRTDAIMEKVTSILNQALFKHIYNVKKKGFQSRVATIASIISDEGTNTLYHSILRKMLVISTHISKLIIDYFARFKMDVEDIFTEFKEELLQTLNEHQGASVIDREFLWAKSNEIKMLMPREDETAEEEIERLNKVGERVLDASTNGLVVDLYFSQYSTEKDYCMSRPTIPNPKQLNMISKEQFLERAHVPGNSSIKSSFVLQGPSSTNLYEALSLLLFANPNSPEVVKTILERHWIHTGNESQLDIPLHSVESCMELIQVACRAFRMSVVVVINESVSVLVTSEYVNHDEAYCLSVSTSSSSSSSSPLLEWAVWIWNKINANDSTNDDEEVQLNEDSFSKTPIKTKSTPDPKKRKSPPPGDKSEHKRKK